MSTERIIHGLAGMAFWLGYLAYRKPDCGVGKKAALLASALLGTWVPDWDLALGVGFHRSPLTHSALPVMAAVWIGRSFCWCLLPVGLAIGLASHLFWDIIFYGDVRWIPGGSNDRLYLLLNGFGMIVWAIRTRRL